MIDSLLVPADAEAMFGILMGCLIPISALMIPIVAIVSGHRKAVLKMKLESQERMNAANHANAGEVEALRSEVRELREALHAQVISMDSLISNQAKFLEHSSKQRELEQRIGGSEHK